VVELVVVTEVVVVELVVVTEVVVVDKSELRNG